jgi:carbonic anhydrase
MRKVALVLSLACALSVSAQKSTDWKDVLVPGNNDFQGKAIEFKTLDVIRGGLTGGQNPRVTVLSCSDSRVPPELVFHQTLGKIFLVRSAGNVTDSLGIASMEYAIKKDWTKLIVILAHEKCGAVEEAMKRRPKPDADNHNLLALIDRIKASFSDQPDFCNDLNDPAKKEKCWAYRTQQNALYTIADLERRSPIIRKAIEDKKVSVVIGLYKLEKGDIEVWRSVN